MSEKSCETCVFECKSLRAIQDIDGCYQPKEKEMNNYKDCEHNTIDKRIINSDGAFLCDEWYCKDCGLIFMPRYDWMKPKEKGMRSRYLKVKRSVLYFYKTYIEIATHI